MGDCDEYTIVRNVRYVVVATIKFDVELGFDECCVFIGYIEIQITHREELCGLKENKIFVFDRADTFFFIQSKFQYC